MKNFSSGFIYGTGAALSVILGWVPDRVEIVNVTDGTPINIGFPSIKTMALSGGGTTAIKDGDVIVGATSGAEAKVVDVLVDTGTWAGGDAAGMLILDADSEVGTFASEAVYVKGGASLDNGTGAATVAPGLDIAAAVATEAAVLTAYKGVAGTSSKGFTMAAAVSVNAKLLHWSAWRDV